MSYHVYYTVLENEEYTKVDSLDATVVETIVYNDICDYSDIPIDILRYYKPEPCGYFPNPYDWMDKLYQASHDYIERYVDNNQVYVYTLDEQGEEIISSKTKVSLDLKKILHKIIQSRSESEQSYIDTGELILRMLSDFIKQGKWQYGYCTADGKMAHDITECCEPILWFGMENEEPIRCWSLSKNTTLSNSENEEWKWFWFCDFWTYAWDVLFAGDEEYFTTWMFAECGMDEPPIEPILQSCPIELNEEDSNEILLDKIEQLFLNTNK